MNVNNLIERRGRCCIPGIAEDLLTKLLEEQIEDLLLAQKRIQKDKSLQSEQKELIKVLGYDPIKEEIEKCEDTKRLLSKVPICPGTKATDIMQEEDYPEGELGTWKKILYTES